MKRVDSVPFGHYIIISNDTLTGNYPEIAKATDLADKKYAYLQALCAKGCNPEFPPDPHIVSNITSAEASAAISNLEFSEMLQPHPYDFVIHSMALEYNGNFYSISLYTS